MRISYNWLKDYIDIKIPPEKLASVLTMAGLAVESITKQDSDYIFEIEVASNRPDWLSYIGVAREVAALTGERLKMHQVKQIHDTRYTIHNTKISVKVEDKKRCPRYTARIIRNVKVGESPDWLKARLQVMGLRPVNNIVDVTNLCLFETGEPMHAFDLDKIEGKEIVVRQAKKGEKILSIDGTERVLDDSTLIIADSARPVAIAGLIGGLNTEVTNSTKNILLEAAFFDSISVRRSSRRLGIMTESSYRFERKVDLANIVYSSNRALGLILKLAGGQTGEFVDIGEEKKSAKTFINLRYSRCNKIVGLEIAPSSIKKILNSLGLKTSASLKNKVKLEIPGFRNDLNSEIDLIEEVSRIYGYDKIPNTIPSIAGEPSRLSSDMMAIKKIRQVLTSLGADEIITYSLLSKKLANSANLSDKNIIEIENPLSNEQEIMRPSLIVGMLNSILWNMNRKTKDLELFELGNIYRKEGDSKFVEKKHLCVALTGQSFSNLVGSHRPFTFFDLKGMTEALFQELGAESVSFEYAKDGCFSPAECASMEIKGEGIGMLGQMDRKILNNFDIKDKVYALEMNIEPILKYVTPEKVFKELPKYPSIYRDISIVIGKEISNSDVTALIKISAGPTLKSVKLVDRYTGEQIPDGKVGLTYRLEYQSLLKTLEDKDVLDCHAKVLRSLEEKLNAKPRVG